VRRQQLAGWVWLPRGSDPVLVELLMGDLLVTTTYTTPQQPAAGRRGRVTAGRRRWAGASGVFPAPPGTLRHADRGEIHTFSLRLAALWPYARRSTKVRVQVNGRPLPIAGHGLYLSPPVDGTHAPQALGELFDRGYVLNQRGQLALAKSLDLEWQREVWRLYSRVRTVLAAEHGLDVFLAYGSLLGAVREGGPIGHDDDLDAAYLSEVQDGPAAADELARVALTLIGHGLRVEASPTHLHITDADAAGHRIDLFHCYFDAAGEIAFPFGVAGTSSFTRDDWQGLTTTRFLGHEVLVPAAGEKVLTHVYGDDWRRPRPGFSWTRARTRAAVSGRLSVEDRTRLHWADFYSRHEFTQESTFARFVMQREDLPHDVLEFGCGDGRDACALAAAGWRVLGADASAEGVERARSKATALDLEGRVRFSVCDVRDRSAVRRHVEELRRDAQGPITVYMRFFLHAISQEAQDGLFRTLDECALPGDTLAVEFRTASDQATRKVHGKHFRRYLVAEGLRAELEETHGFTVSHFVESRGLSPFGDEDPVLCRIIAHRAVGILGT
jgi:Methyltransferase domain/LicD family